MSRHGIFKFIVLNRADFFSIILGETGHVSFFQIDPSSGGGAIAFIEFVLKIDICWYG